MPKEKTLVASASETLSPAQQAARRLRRVQISFADEPADRRRAYLADELEAVLKTVPIDQREAFLNEIEADFPVWGGQGQAAEPVQERAVAASRTEETLDGLIAKLAGQAAKMNAAEREALAAKLAELGLVRVDRPTGDSGVGRPMETGDNQMVRESLRYIARSLKVTNVNVARSANMSVMLAIYMGQLDDVVWKAWQAVSPRSGLRRKASLEKLLQSYIGGDPAIGGTDLNTQIATTKKLLTAFIAAVGQLGVQFARQHLSAFSPQEIQIAVNRKGPGLLVGQDAACWAHYQKIARGLEEGAVDDAIREIVAKMVTDMMSHD